MENTTPNDSILLPEGIVEDDAKLLILNKVFSEITDGKFFGTDNQENEEAYNENLKD